jgi:hypothetical protein
MMIFK